MIRMLHYKHIEYIILNQYVYRNMNIGPTNKSSQSVKSITVCKQYRIP